MRGHKRPKTVVTILTCVVRVPYECNRKGGAKKLRTYLEYPPYSTKK